MQLKVKQLLQSKTKENIDANKGKIKEVVDVDQFEDTKVETKPRRLRTRGLTKKKEKETEPSPPLG